MEVKLGSSFDNAMSFYGKAHVIVGDTYKKLRSYDTVVCGIVNNNFEKYWDDYSSTTMRHINEFRLQNGMPKLSKAEWNKIPTVKN